jgi:hypothetical protein
MKPHKYIVGSAIKRIGNQMGKVINSNNFNKGSNIVSWKVVSIDKKGHRIIMHIVNTIIKIPHIIGVSEKSVVDIFSSFILFSQSHSEFCN